MGIGMKVFLLVTALILVGTSLSQAADGTKDAAWKPQKAVTLVVPLASGSIYDSIARVFASELGKVLGQPVVVQNMPGAGNALAIGHVYKVKPDGYTLLYAGANSLITNQFVYNASFDFRKFEYLAQVYDNTKTISVVLVSGTKSGLNSWDDVMKLSRPVRFGTSGKGSPPFVTSLAIANAFGIKNPVYILGYTGTADILGAAARNECDVTPLTWSSTVPFVKSGDVQPIMGLSNLDRVPGYPKVPISGELGRPELVAQTGATHWITAPLGTPAEVVKVLREASYAVASGKVMKEYHDKSISGGTCWVPLRGEEGLKAVEDMYKKYESFLPVLAANK
jgi:tripartite-type tricarboxylate transporter receptor subunit TctC